MFIFIFFFFFKQKTAYEMRISDWSSDVCSSDLDPYGCPMSSCRPPFRRTRVGPSALPEHVCPGQGTCSSDVVVEGELVGVGAQAQGVDLASALVGDPRLEIGRAHV